MNTAKLMADAIDLHVHCAPDAFSERRVDALQLAQQASEAGMKAVVIKSHQFCTAPIASTINKIINRPILLGSIVLNACVGGLNPEAVRIASKEGAKIIWMPTKSAKAEIEAHSVKIPNNRELAKDEIESYSAQVPHYEKIISGISVLDNSGNLVSEMKEILAIIKNDNLVLATSHISIQEAIAVANTALEMGIKTIITHPFAKLYGDSITLEQAKDLIKKGAFIEFCFNACMPPMRLSPLDIVNYVKILGAVHCLLTTDFGQLQNPPPTEGFRMMLSQMIRFGISENELETIVKTNPHKLLFSQ